MGRLSTRASARLVLLLGGLSLLIWLAGVLLLMHQAATGTPPYEYWRETMLNTLVFSAVGVVVATRRPAHPIGWLLLAAGLIDALGFLSGEYAATTLAPGQVRLPYGPTGAWLSMLMQITNFFPLLFLLLLFPTGQLLSSRWRIVAWVGVCGVSLGAVTEALTPGALEDFDNPFGIHAAILGPLNVAAQMLVLAALLGALLSLVVRLVRSRGEERQQIKWFVAAAVLGFFVLFGISLLSSELGVGLGGLGNWIWAVVGASLPIAIGIAVLRYRLYEIDLIINRTLVYGTLTATLVAVYFGGIALLQGISSVVLQVPFRALTGQDSQLATVAATLAIAALFNPLRRRIQGFIDRRFYRRKYDAVKTLEAFSAKLRNETDLDALSNDLVGVVRETVQPAHVSLWLHPDPALKDRERAAIRESGHDE
jgi:hypothetical protein